MTSPLNTAILKLSKRAESAARPNIIETFVDVGPLFALLESNDHQILLGRRGTGKTHVLNYLAQQREEKEDCVAIIDLRNVGSNAGLYADGTIPLSERATRLLVDTLAAVHESLYDYFVTNAEELDLSQTGPALDRLSDAITQIKVHGPIEKEESGAHSQQSESARGFRATATPQTAGFSIDANRTTSEGASFVERVIRTGHEQLYVNFGTTASALRNIISCLQGRRLWLLLDEWSSVPIELQPYLGACPRNPARWDNTQYAAMP